MAELGLDPKQMSMMLPPRAEATRPREGGLMDYWSGLWDRGLLEKHVGVALANGSAAGAWIQIQSWLLQII